MMGSTVDGVVGHTDTGSIVFFPAATLAGDAVSDIVREVGSDYQNVLSCGEQVFLLHGGADQSRADVHHLGTGGWVRVSIAHMRDALLAEAAGEPIVLQSVSATRDHFMIHTTARSGAKLAAAVRLPSAAAGAMSVGAVEWATANLSFCKRWPPEHPISQLRHPCAELPVDDALLLHGDWGREGVQVCLVHSSTGQLQCQLLRPPSRGSAAHWSFEERGVGALTVVPQRSLACGCGTAPADLRPPPVVLWDLETGLVLAELGLGNPGPGSQPQPPQPWTTTAATGEDEGQARSGCSGAGGRRDGDPSGGTSPPAQRALRFGVGDRVECCTNAGWVAGQIIACRYREESWPDGEFAPYQIECADGSLLYAPEDTAQLVRQHIAGHRYEEDRAMQISLCPSTQQVLLGIFHQRQAVSRLHLVRCAREGAG